MKKWTLLTLTMVALLAFNSTAHAKKEAPEEAAAAAAPGPAPYDMRYWNGEYRFEFLYGGDWYVHEFKSGSYRQRTISVPNLPSMPNMPKMPRMSSFTMPRMVNVCFATKRKCESKNPGMDPEAHLTISNLAQLENAIPPSMRKQMPQAEPAEPAAPQEQGKRPDCDELEKTNVNWGGTKALWMAMSCPTDEGRVVSAMASMQRKARQGEDMYSLMCTMGVKAKDKVAAEAAYRDELKPRCEKIVKTTKFIP